MLWPLWLPTSCPCSPFLPHEQLLTVVVGGCYSGGGHELSYRNVMSIQQGQMITHLTKILAPAYPHITVTSWKQVWYCPGMATYDPYLYLCIPVTTLSQCYLYLCYSLATTGTTPLFCCKCKWEGFLFCSQRLQAASPSSLAANASRGGGGASCSILSDYRQHPPFLAPNTRGKVSFSIY
jgi:hypothetical protein